jgi:hypothetical protein
LDASMIADVVLTFFDGFCIAPSALAKSDPSMLSKSDPGILT